MSVITRERIFQIADEIESAGQNPTLSSVRKRLGGGSFSTLSKTMAEWREAYVARKKRPAEPAPQDISERFLELGWEIWAMALENANARLAGEREAFEAARIQLEADKAEAAEVADQMATEVDTMKGRMAALEIAESDARNKAEGLRAHNADISERLAVAEARVVEILKRADDLSNELARVNRQNSELVNTLAESASRKESPSSKR